mgnify:CR=1 FL=1
MTKVTEHVSPEYWQKYLEWRLNTTRDVMASKSAEYATGGDKLHNFNRALQASAGRMSTREGALFGMMLKHWVSILDILDKVDVGGLPTEPILKEKFGDMINYLMLLEASIQHRIDTKNGATPEPQVATKPTECKMSIGECQLSDNLCHCKATPHIDEALHESEYSQDQLERMVCREEKED